MNLDLKGLKVAWIGLVLSLIASAISSTGSSTAFRAFQAMGDQSAPANINIGASFGGFLALAAFILVIVGLSMAKDVSDYFRKARNLQIANLVTGIAVVVACAALVIAGIIGISNGSGMAGVIAWLVVIVVLVILMIVFGLLFYRNLLYGCTEVASAAGDETLAEKFEKIWKMFIAGLLLVAAGIVATVIGVILAVQSGLMAILTNFDVLRALHSFGAIAPGLIILAVGWILVLICSILLLVRIAQLFAYDGK